MFLTCSPSHESGTLRVGMSIPGGAPMVAWTFVMLLAQPVEPGRIPVAVVAVGEDALATGLLQRELERQVDMVAGTSAVRAADAARILGLDAPPAAAPDPGERDRAESLLDEAINFYYQAQYVRSLDALSRLQALHEGMPAVPVSERIAVRLWRIAVFLGLKDQDQVVGEARAVLTIDPEYRIDPRSDVPPSVQAELDRVRATIAVLTVLVSGLPPQAELTCDGRPVPSRFGTAVGRHTIAASAEGLRTVTRTFDATSDVSVTIALPLALPPETERGLRGLVARGYPEPQDTEGLADLARRLGTEWILLASTEDEGSKAVLLHAKGSFASAASEKFPDGTEGRARLARWTAQRTALSLLLASGRTPSIWPRRTLRGGPSGVAVDVGVVVSRRVRTVSGGQEYRAVFGGAGPRLAATARRGALALGGSVELLDYEVGLATFEVRFADGRRRVVGGGRTFRGDLEGSIIAGSEDGPSVRLAMVMEVEEHASRDVRYSATDTPTGMFPGHRRAAAGALVAGEIPLGPWVRLDGSLSLRPYGVLVEDPRGSTGSSPRTGTALGGTVGASVRNASRPRWTVRFGYSGDRIETAYSGTGDAPLSPPFVNAKVEEDGHRLYLSVFRVF